jgi:hypothetical protein
MRAMPSAPSKARFFPPLTLAVWIALALLTLGAAGCAELSSQKAENINTNQYTNRYDYFGWW